MKPLHNRKFSTKLLALSAIVIIAFFASASAETTFSATPEQTAVEFYRWYVDSLNRNREPKTRQKQKLLTFLSKRYGKWVYSIPDEEYDADVFISAQDYDEDWVNAISTSKATIKGNVARLDVILGVYKNGKRTKGIGKHVLHLKMVKENGAWKIDDIKGDH